MSFAGRPTCATIDLNALRHNYRIIKNKVSTADVMAVIKADAYGHGAVEVARTLNRDGVRHFGVAIFEEAMELKKHGIRGEIFILSGIFRGQEEEIIRNRFIPLVFDIETVRRFSISAKRLNTRARMHIKVDTGMGRIGILPWEADVFFKKLKRFQNIEIDGIASHFSDTGNGDTSFAKEQLKQFNAVISSGIKQNFNFKKIHIANSAAVFLLPASHFNLVRPGIALYGAEPFAGCKAELRPVMELRTKVLYTKRVPRGFTVSYGRTYVAKKESIIATIPIGYADGLNRLLSNNGKVIIRGRYSPIVGRVCMDLTMIDVTGIEGVKAGDDVVIIGKQGVLTISAVEIANRIGTIAYEIFCLIGKRVPRKYI